MICTDTSNENCDPLCSHSTIHQSQNDYYLAQQINKTETKGSIQIEQAKKNHLIITIMNLQCYPPYQ